MRDTVVVDGCTWLGSGGTRPFRTRTWDRMPAPRVQARGPGEANVPVAGHPEPEGARGRVANRPPSPSLSLTRSFARGITKRFLLGHY